MMASRQVFQEFTKLWTQQNEDLPVAVRQKRMYEEWRRIRGNPEQISSTLLELNNSVARKALMSEKTKIHRYFPYVNISRSTQLISTLGNDSSPEDSNSHSEISGVSSGVIMETETPFEENHDRGLICQDLSNTREDNGTPSESFPDPDIPGDVNPITECLQGNNTPASPQNTFVGSLDAHDIYSGDSTTSSSVSLTEDTFSDVDSLNESVLEEAFVPVRPKKRALKQNLLLETIEAVEESIWVFSKKKAGGLHLTDHEESSFQSFVIRRDEMRKALHALQRHAKCQEEYRMRQKEKYEDLLAAVPQPARSAFTQRSKVGRPALIEKEPRLHEVIMSLLSHDLQASDRRRLQSLRSSCRTLDDIYLAVKKELPCLPISRSGLYFQFLPKNAKTASGRRHIKTVPVKLIRPKKDDRKVHNDSHFCFASFKHIRDLIETLGDDAVFVVSQDDKARVPIGVAAATVQKPMVMRLDRPVRLPDHDYVLGEKRKLIPSVYAVGLLNANAELTYSGPTAVYLRIAKHDSTSHASHAYDIQDLMEHPTFTSFSRTKCGSTKPVHVVMTDGGPDENSRNTTSTLT